MRLILLSLLLSSCAGYNRVQDERYHQKINTVTVLLDQGKYDEAADKLNGIELDLFQSGRLLDKISSQRNISTLGYSSDHKPLCDEKISALLFKANVKPSEKAIYNYVIAPCPDLAKKVIEMADKKTLEASSKLIVDFVSGVTVEQNKLASEKLEPNEERDLGLLQQIVPSLKLLEEKSDSADDIHALAESINKLADSRKFFASKEGQDSLAMSSVCSLYRKKNDLEASIQDEKQKGKISGFVNVYKLKTWGDELHDTIGQLNTALDSYRNVTKKKFTNFKGCE